MSRPNSSHVAGTCSLTAGLLLMAADAAGGPSFDFWSISQFVGGIILVSLAGLQFSNAAKQNNASKQEELNRLRNRIEELEKQKPQGPQE